MKRPPDDSSLATDEAGEAPGVPGFRSWRRVYLFVFGVFVVDVILLAVFTRWFA